jgi:hypothetical protein
VEEGLAFIGGMPEERELAFLGEEGVLEQGVFAIGRDLQWMHGLRPCTTSSFGCPPQISYKIASF